ncbi:MerR family transcriptional regulator [Romboutsia lituseburensis]|uniref:MerR family transcriptional regulator n=1 Tax=Romboutsia lituseburensis TaxID=1537 RepID=UPI002ED22096
MTITEVSEKFGFSQDTLRYYEKIGLIANINRDNRVRRNYLKEDCNGIEFIKCMRRAGLAIETLIEYAEI